MIRYMAILLIFLLSFTISACGNDIKGGENNSTVQDMETIHTDNNSATESGAELNNKKETEEDKVETNQIYIKVGESTLTVVLEDNESVKALEKLLQDGPLIISASNYGGFEKVCSLGKELPSNDSQTTTHAGDVCLYNGSQIVIFYGSNSWAYTRLGKISNADESELEKVLSGKETEITLSLESYQ